MVIGGYKKKYFKTEKIMVVPNSTGLIGSDFPVTPKGPVFW